MKAHQSFLDLYHELKDVRDRGTHFIDDEKSERFVSYEEMFGNARSYIRYFEEKGIPQGSELIFQIDDTNNEAFTTLYWAGLLSRRIPVPIMVSSFIEHRLKVLRVFEILEKPYLVTTPEILDKLKTIAMNHGLSKLWGRIGERTIFVHDLMRSRGEGGLCEVTPDETAFIQFSSGSTGDPKGIVLTHRNILTNIHSINRAQQTVEKDVMLSWLPLTHDMGIFLAHTPAVMAGIDQHMIPTSVFTRYPTLWIQKVSEKKATLLYSPNFGCHLFLSLLDKTVKRDWNLSSVKAIINGAEPISVEVTNRFLETLAPYGLSKNAMIPAFGLAEACVCVTMSPLHEPYLSYRLSRKDLSIGDIVSDIPESDGDGVFFVDLGTVLDDCSLRIGDHDGNALEDDRIGYILIKGKNVIDGYYKNDAATSEAKTKDGFLKTGDLGFIRNGRLIFTGREKEIIIINGQNYYPYDIERNAESIAGIEPGRIAACGIFDRKTQKELIALFVIFRKPLEEFIPIAISLKREINVRMGLEVKDVIPLKILPKTTSGKIQRFKLKDDFEAGAYRDIIADLDRRTDQLNREQKKIKPSGALEKNLHSIWQALLENREIGVDENFFELGGHSLTAANLVSRIQAEFGVEIKLGEIFESLKTIQKQALYIEHAEKKDFQAIEGNAGTGRFAASSSQKRQYVLYQLDKLNTAYNVPVAGIIEGEFDLSKLEDALHRLIGRHQSLRTSFDFTQDGLYQIVSDRVEFKIEKKNARENQIQDLIREFIRPFDFAVAPLFRVCVASLNHDRHLLLIDMPHIVTDGMSMAILFRELGSLYSGGELPVVRLNYSDYALWQMRQLESDKIIEQSKFWIEQFKGEIPVLDLPLDKPRRMIPDYSGSRIRFEIGKGLTDGLRKQGVETGSTLFIVLLASLYVLLYRLSGQEDIVIGTPTAGRHHSDLKDLVGMFVNTLAFRSYPNGEKSILDFLGEVKKTVLSGLENQDYQFEDLVEKLDISRDLSRSPLFDVMFSLQNQGTIELKLGDSAVIPYPIETNLAKFDLNWIVTEDRNELKCELEFKAGLFLSRTSERFCGYWIEILKAMVRNPSVKIGDIEMIPEQEIGYLVRELNKTDLSYDDQKTIHEVFEENARRFGDKAALVVGGESISYGELNAKANRLAGLLRAKGVGPDRIVALMLERSFDMIIGILGVLKAGGAYLPLDAEFPDERLQYMLMDSHAILLLQHEQTAHKSVPDIEIVNLNRIDPELSDSSNLENINKSTDLAYIIYTSGTTGEPKGVMIEHRNVLNLKAYFQHAFHFTDTDNGLQFAPYTFDASAGEIFMVLLYGSTLCIPSRETIMNFGEFVKFMNTNRIAFAAFPPPYLIHLNPDDMSSIKRLMSAGSAPSPDILEKWKHKVEYINAYGPTETTVISTAWSSKSGEINNDVIPIGRPICNTRVYIFDKYRKLQPTGVVGELCIAGDGLSRGYVNKKQLTDEKFIDNPYVPGEKMYRTGDLAKWQSDGNIVFAGRIDDQVKIRGFRIELGEIEGALLTHPDIREAVVVDKEDSAGGKYLCAYTVHNDGTTSTELRSFLQRILPSYMVPSYFVSIPMLPLTPHGKIDKKNLPEPTESANDDEAIEPPRTPTEERLQAIWKEILGTQKIGVTQNFFNIGGQSLKASVMVSRIQKEFKIDLPLGSVFQEPTIRQIALNIDKAGTQTHSEIAPAPVRERYILSTAQRRLYIVSKVVSGSGIYYNIPSVFQIRGGLDIARLESGFRKIIARHDAFRTSFEMFQSNPYQIIHDRVDFSMEVGKCESDEIESEIRKFIRPFELAQAPLFRAGILNVSPELSILMIDMHHIISDGLSLEIIIEEIVKEYTDLPIESPTLQYKDYAEWESVFVKSEESRRQKEYWLEQFKAPLHVMNLPTDNPRPAVQNLDGKRKSFFMEKSLYEEVRKTERETGVTLFMILYAVYFILMHKYTAQEDLVIGTVTSGRRRMELEKIVGMFVNTLAIRSMTDKNSTFEEFLARLKTSVILAFENQDYPYDGLIEELDFGRDFSRNPLFDVVFVLQNRSLPSLEVGDIKIRPYSFDYPVSKFDITLNVEENDDGLAFIWEYSTTLFKEKTIDRFARDYFKIADQITRNKYIKIRDIKLETGIAFTDQSAVGDFEFKF